MKKLITILLILAPFSAHAFATTSAPFFATSTNYVFPGKINGTEPNLTLRATGTSTFDGSIYIKKNLQVDGNISAGINLIPTTFTTGSVLFVGTGATLSQNNSGFFWDNTNNRLGIGTAAPTSPLVISDGSRSLHFKIGFTASGEKSTNWASIGQTDGGYNTYLGGNGTPTSGQNGILYYNGTQYYSALEVNNVASGFSNLNLMRSGGNVGIGTTNPGQLLYVAKDQNAATLAQVNNDTSGTAAAAGFTASYGDTARYVQLLNLNPSFTTSGLSVTGAAVLRSNGALGGLRMFTMDAYDVTIGTDNTARITVQATTGNVGIGTTSPSATLAISGPVGSYGPLLVRSNQNRGNGNLMTLMAGNSAATGEFFITDVGDITSSLGTRFNLLGTSAKTVYSGNWRVGDNSNNFVVQDTGSSQNVFEIEKNGVAGSLYIKSNGNVGIGTTSPSQKLSVQGNGLFSGNLSVANITATGTLSFANLLATGSSTLQNFTFVNATGTSATTTNFFSTTASSTNLFSSLLTVGGNAIVTTAARNVGIGTAAPTNKLEVNGNSYTSGYVRTPTLEADTWRVAGTAGGLTLTYPSSINRLGFSGSSYIQGDGNGLTMAGTPGFVFGANVSSGTNKTFWRFTNNFTLTAVSGVSLGISTDDTFAPTSGTATYTNVSLAPTINQTGGANGITRGLYINPTITAAADFRSFEVATGTSIFGGKVRLKGYTVATLPAGTQGDTAFVTDLLTPTFLTAAVGGGAVVGPVFYNGSAWVSY